MGRPWQMCSFVFTLLHFNSIFLSSSIHMYHQTTPDLASMPRGSWLLLLVAVVAIVEETNTGNRPLMHHL